MKLASYAKKDEFIGRGLEIFGLNLDLKKEIENILPKIGNPKILEIGCGKGILLLNLIEKYPKLKLIGVNKHQTHGIQNKKELVERAKEYGLELAAGQIPDIHFADATKLPFPNETFDIIVSHVSFLHVENKAKALSEAHRVLKKEGKAFISLGGYSIRRKQGHAMSPFYKSLRRKLGVDINPRFLIKKGKHFLPFSTYIKELSKLDDIKLKVVPFVSKTQRGLAHWLLMTKKKSGPLETSVRYLKKESLDLTEKYAKNNPVNWGVIDIYEKK